MSSFLPSLILRKINYWKILLDKSYFKLRQDQLHSSRKKEDIWGLIFFYRTESTP